MFYRMSDKKGLCGLRTAFKSAILTAWVRVSLLFGKGKPLENNSNESLHSNIPPYERVVDRRQEIEFLKGTDQVMLAARISTWFADS